MFPCNQWKKTAGKMGQWEKTVPQHLHHRYFVQWVSVVFLFLLLGPWLALFLNPGTVLQWEHYAQIWKRHFHRTHQKRRKAVIPNYPNLGHWKTTRIQRLQQHPAQIGWRRLRIQKKHKKKPKHQRLGCESLGRGLYRSNKPSKPI